MATREIKTRFKLEGEQAYKKAMTDAANAIKVLKSEQRLAAAEFEASGDAQEYASQQARILAREIEEQQKAVQAAERAVEQLTRNGVEPSSKQMVQWKTKLNDAKAALKKMETQLNETESEISDQNSALGRAKTAYTTAEAKIKSLSAEEKLAEAQFRATGDQEQYAAEKTRILKEKIEAQKEAVAAAEAAIKSMTDNGVDPASAEMIEWKDKLVTAKTKLADLEGQLSDTEAELSDQNRTVRDAKAAMSDAEAKIKSLTAEEKLAESQFKATGDEEQYAAEKTRILKEKIEAQKEAVAAAEAAIKSMTDNGVDPASEEMVEWKDKLITAKTKLADLEGQLSDTEAELSDQNRTVRDAKAAMSDAEAKIKSLTAEEKLAESQFKATGDEEQYAAEKTRILKEKIEAQKEAVAAAEAAIKSMTDNGVDPASAEMVEWKDKLVTAKTKLADLEGQLQDTEAEFSDQNRAVRDAKTEMGNAEAKIKSLTAEEKLAEAQFKATGNAEDLLSEKTRILKEKIDAQKTAVKAAETAIKSLTDNGIDPNSAEVVDWKNKLATAKAGLLALETRLDHVGDEVAEETKAFDGAGSEADELKASIDKVGEGVDFQNVISSIDGLTSTFESVVSAAARAAKEIWQFGVNAGTWADDIATAAAQLDIDPETYQSWQYASQFIDTNVTDIQKSWQDIQKNLKENNLDYMAELARLRVATRTTNGTLRSSEDIFWDIIDRLHDMKDPTEQAAEATKIFGNDWRKLKPLINAGSAAYKELAEEGRTVAVVSNEDVEALGSLDDSMQKLNSQAQKLKNEAIAKLSPSFLFVSSSASRALTALDGFLNSAEGKATIEALNTAIENLIRAFLGEDNGEGTFKAIIEGATSAINGFTDVLKWAAENGETVRGIIVGLGTAYAALKVAKPVLQFMELLQKTPLSKLTSIFGGGAAAQAAAGEAAQAAGGAARAASASGGLPFAPAAVGLGGAAAIGYGFAKAAEARNEHVEQMIDTAEHLAAATAGDKALQEAFEEYVRTQREMNEGLDKNLSGEMSDEEFEKVIERANAASEAFLGMENAEKALDAYNAWRAGNSINDMDWILPENWEELGLGATDGLVSGVESGLGAVDEAGAQTGDTLAEAARRVLDEHSPSRVFEVIGGNAAVGLANGIYRRGDEAIRAARWLADSVTAIVQSALDIHSPSRVFEQLGSFTGLGFARGIEGSAAAVGRAVDRMVGATSRRPASSYGGISLPSAGTVPARIAGAAAGGAGTVHVTMVLDEEVLGDVMAPIVNGKIGAKMQAVRR